MHEEEEKTKKERMALNNDKIKYCKFCQKSFKRLDLHERKCRSKSSVEEEEEKETKKEMTPLYNAGSKIKKCQFCQQSFKRLDLHQPKCKSKLSTKEEEESEEEDEGEENDEEEEKKEEKGAKSKIKQCKFCQQSFKRLDLHQPKCKSKLSTKEEEESEEEDEGEENDEEEEKKEEKGAKSKIKQCKFCQQSFKRLDLHQPKCKSKLSTKEEEESEEEDEGKENDEEEEKKEEKGAKSKIKQCKFCQQSFKRLDLHQPKCKSKLSTKEEEESEEEENDEEEEKKEEKGAKSKIKQCKFCQQSFKRLDLHQPKCKSKPLTKKEEEEENEEENEDEEEKEEEKKEEEENEEEEKENEEEKKEEEENEEEEEKQEENEEEAKEEEMPPFYNPKSKIKKCKFCKKVFIRLGLHQPKCKSKPLTEKEENGAKPKIIQCQFCQQSFKRLDLHLPKCLSNPNYNKVALKKKGQVLFDRFLYRMKAKRSAAPAVNNINDLMDGVVKKLNDSRPLDWQKIKSGSYYSRLKIDKPDEYDYMMCPTKIKCRIEQSEENPCYCRVFVTNKTKIPIEFREILKDNNELTPTKFREYVFKVFDLYLKENCRNRRMSRVDTQETCPAYTVKYSYGKKYADIDWVPCLKVDEYPRPYAESIKRHSDFNLKTKELYVVPKTLATAEGRRDLWRVSYSMIEKEIICDVYTLEHRKIVKALKKILKETKKDDDEDRKLCSYHVLSHCLSFFKNNQMGKEKDFYSHCYDVMRALIDRLKSRTLGHYFIPNFNLLEDVTDEEAREFIERLQYYLGEWYDMSDGGADDDEDGGDDGAAAAYNNTADDGTEEEEEEADDDDDDSKI